MPTIPLPLGSVDEPQASSARLINCYIEQQPPGARSPVRLVRAPGIRTLNDSFPGQTFYALHHANGWLWMVTTLGYGNPSAIYVRALNPLGTVVAGGPYGLIPSVGQPVSIADNGAYIVTIAPPIGHYIGILPTGSPYPVDPGSPPFDYITDADFTARGAAEVCFLDNYLLFREPNTGRFFGADLGSATSFDALNFATAESQPDNLVGMIADHGQLILLGDDSVEIWENAGVQGFPFQRIPNGRVEIGCKAGYSKAQVDQSVVWVASDGTVRRLSGATPQRISTHAIERHLSGDIADARGYSYTHDGHVCYTLTTANRTFVCDMNTQLWHERKSYGFDTWQARFHVQSAGRTIVAYKDKLGYLDSTCYDECGDPLVMQWTYEPVPGEGRRIFHDRLELEVETGVGLLTGQGSDPTILLEYSDDGGDTFRPLPSRSLGARGDRTHRVVWTGLGSSYNRVYRCTVSDPVKVVVTDTQLTIR